MTWTRTTHVCTTHPREFVDASSVTASYLAATSATPLDSNKYDSEILGKAVVLENPYFGRPHASSTNLLAESVSVDAIAEMVICIKDVTFDMALVEDTDALFANDLVSQ